MGVYIKGSRNIGNASMTIEQAPEGSAGVYQVTMEMNMEFGPNKHLGKETKLLDASLAMISSEQEETETAGPETTVKTEKISQQDGQWVIVTTENDTTEEFKLAIEAANHWEVPSLFLLSRVIELQAGKKYQLSGLSFEEEKPT